MNFDINNFVIDKVIRGVMTSTDDGSYLWSVNQISDPVINCTTESKEAVDAIGSTIMQFDQAKKAEFSASNSLFDLGMLAAQLGTSKKVASTTNKVVVPKFETVDVTAATTVVLSQKPTKNVDAIYELKGDSTLGTKYTAGTAANTTRFVYNSSTKTITLPTGLTTGSQLLIMYEYESDAAVEVSNSATQFPSAGKFVMEVLGADVCNPSVLYHAFVIFPAAKLDGNVDVGLATDSKFGFKITCMQEYCDKEKRLFRIVVPEADA